MANFSRTARKRLVVKHTAGGWEILTGLLLIAVMTWLRWTIMHLLIMHAVEQNFLTGRATYSVWAIVLLDKSVFLAFVALGLQVHFRLFRRSIHRALPEFCVHCAYCLVGVPEPRCPECGTPFDPTIPRSPQRLEALAREGRV